MNHTNDQAQNGLRRAQVGTGERAGVKRRTWRFQDDVVVDTVNNKSARAATVLSSGNFELLWD